MNTPFKLPGHPDLNLSLSTGFFSWTTILKDGVPLERVDGIVNIPLADGSSLELKIKMGFDLFTPKVEFRRRNIEVFPRLHWLWMIWAYLPLFLIFVGGAIGGFFGGLATGSTIMALRSGLPRPIKILIGILVPPVGVLAYWIIATLVVKWRQ
ncbi:MAG: hypothetical protein H0X66_21485 [Verrucomicrobia bacterium]|nr:hypothetical protein [Verrucomicrobiota bacterium]